MIILASGLEVRDSELKAEGEGFSSVERKGREEDEYGKGGKRDVEVGRQNETHEVGPVLISRFAAGRER